MAQRKARLADAAPETEGAGPPAGRPRSLNLPRRVRLLRSEADLTLKQLSTRSGISISAISKIENGQLSPTYENIIRLARGLNVDIAVLFTEETPAVVTGRRTITRRGGGVRYRTPNYDYEMLGSDLSSKRMIPLIATVKAGSIREFGPLIAHEGEEVIYVLSGSIVLHTQFYEPTLLDSGDCAYFDSRMSHACIVQGAEDAVLFWVCSSSQINEMVRRSSEAGPPANIDALSETTVVTSLRSRGGPGGPLNAIGFTFRGRSRGAHRRSGRVGLPRVAAQGRADGSHKTGGGARGASRHLLRGGIGSCECLP